MSDLSSFINVSSNTIVSSGDITAAGGASPAPSINGYYNASFGGALSATGNITGGANLNIDGNASIDGNLFVTGNINFTGNVTQISGNSGVFYGNASTGEGALYAGITSYTPLPSTVVQMTGDANAYIQINAENQNHGTQASMEYVVTGDRGTDTTDYIDLGFAGSAWDGTQDNSLGNAASPRDGWLYVQGGGGGGNLILGVTTAGRSIKFNAGGPNVANTVATIDAGGFTATGNVTAGYLKGEGGNISNIAVANINGLGNIATINTDGNASNILYGNGVFAAAPSGGGYGNSNVATFLANYGSNTITTTGNVQVGNIIGNGQALTGLTGANVTGTVANANYSVYSGTASVANSVAGANVTGAVTYATTANSVAGANVTGTVASATNASALLQNTSTSTTVYPTFTTSSANGNSSAVFNTSISSNLANASITATTFVGALSGAATTAGTVTTNAQPNITSVGTLSSLSVSGNITTGNIIGIFANGNSNISIPSANGNVNISAIGNANVLVITGTGATVTGTLSATTDVWANSGNFRTSASTANIVNMTPTTVNIAGGASIAVNIGNSSGLVNLAGNVQGNTNGFAIGYRDIPQLAFTGNTTIALTDAGKHYYSTLSTANTLTIANNATVGFATGTAINIINQGTGNITIAQGTGVTMYLAGNSTSGNRTLSSYGMATIQKVATDTWFIVGVGVT